MSLRIYNDLEQRSPEWYDVRRGILTASVVGSLITERSLTGIDYGCQECGALADQPCVSLRGGAPIKTLHSLRTSLARDMGESVLEPISDIASRPLTALLVAERITGWTEDTYQSEAMLRGILDEPIARDVYARHYGVDVEQVGFMVLTLPSGARFGYSPDGLVGDDGLIEIKSRAPREQVRVVLGGEVPNEHMAQIQAGLLVSGRRWCDYLSFSGGLPMWVKRVERDDEWIALLLDVIGRFEETAGQMVADFTAAVEGLPATERQNYGMDVELKL